MEEVEFVDDDDTGFSFLRNDAGNAAVLLRDARRNVNDQQADIRPADAFSLRMAEKTSTEVSRRERGRMPAVSIST